MKYNIVQYISFQIKILKIGTFEWYETLHELTNESRSTFPLNLQSR